MEKKTRGWELYMSTWKIRISVTSGSLIKKFVCINEVNSLPLRIKDSQDFPCVIDLLNFSIPTILDPWDYESLSRHLNKICEFLLRLFLSIYTPTYILYQNFKIIFRRKIILKKKIIFGQMCILNKYQEEC